MGCAVSHAPSGAGAGGRAHDSVCGGDPTDRGGAMSISADLAAARASGSTKVFHMRLFDELKSAAGSLLGGQTASSPVAKSAEELLGQRGGLNSLIQTLQQKGLGGVVNSWVGTGHNLPISAQQVQQALGGHVQQLAAQHGLSPEAVSQPLSQGLPGLIDHLTPGGQVSSGQSLEQGLTALRSKLGL